MVEMTCKGLKNLIFNFFGDSMLDITQDNLRVNQWVPETGDIPVIPAELCGTLTGHTVFLFNSNNLDAFK